MKFSELKTKINDNTLNINEDLKFIEPSIILQRQLIEVILRHSMLEEDDDGLKKLDYIVFEIFKTATIVEAFMDVDVEITMKEDGIDVFDITAMADVYDTVIKSEELIAELDVASCRFEDLLEISLEQEIRLANSLEVILSRGLNKIIEKLPNNKDLTKLIGKIPSMINKIKPESLSNIKNAIDFNKGVK